MDHWTTGILEWPTGMDTYLTRCLLGGKLGGKVGLGPYSNLVLQLLR